MVILKRFNFSSEEVRRDMLPLLGSIRKGLQAPAPRYFQLTTDLRNIKLTLEYDGSRFFGFQRQKDKPTVQGELERALSQLFNHSMKISAAAGRTDAGAHAKGQVVNFKYPLTPTLSPEGRGKSRDKIQRGLNALLPKDIAVKRVEEVPADFHARYGAKSKTYEYLVLNSKIRSPLLNGRVYQFPYPLDLKAMKKAARQLVGCHDFKAFQASGSSVKDTFRFVRRFTISVFLSPHPLPQGERVGVRGELIRFTIEADGFLYHMVRNIVGVLLEAGRGKLSLRDFSSAVKRRKPFLKGATVPASGLTLVSVKY